MGKKLWGYAVDGLIFGAWFCVWTVILATFVVVGNKLTGAGTWIKDKIGI